MILLPGVGTQQQTCFSLSLCVCFAFAFALG